MTTPGSSPAIDIVIRRDPLHTRQPELMVISSARCDVITLQVIEGGSDLVIAMLSLTDILPELQGKSQAYQTIGLREAWRVSPQAQTVEVLQLSAEGIQRLALYGPGHLDRFRKYCPRCSLRWTNFSQHCMDSLRQHRSFNS